MLDVYKRRQRRRRCSSDVPVEERWFLMSRVSYQRILDDALRAADMTSQCSSETGSSELVRLLTDDVMTTAPQSTDTDDDVKPLSLVHGPSATV